MAALVLAGCSSSSSSSATGARHSTSSSTSTTIPTSTTLATAFLDRYVVSDGRVVRWDQGADTVSEGQAYGMLLAVAARDASRFSLIWTWTREKMQQPDGLMGYDWAGGKLVSTTPATDADLDTAWALVLAAAVFHTPAYKTQGLAVAQGILANETVTAGGQLQLVAGPWARTAPYSVDASYFSPEAMAALATASGDPRWTQLATDSQQLLADLQEPGGVRSLPPDWALLSAGGAITASPAPSGGKPISYGLDAQRIPIWYAADCTASGRALSGDDWPTISDLAASGAYQAYSLLGAVQVDYLNDLGLVAAAASADAVGQTSEGAALLARAQRGDHGKNYYGDAWVALGTVLLTSTLLSPCPPAPAG